jgi:hypothetical protein
MGFVFSVLTYSISRSGGLTPRRKQSGAIDFAKAMVLEHEIKDDRVCGKYESM